MLQATDQTLRQMVTEKTLAVHRSLEGQKRNSDVFQIASGLAQSDMENWPPAPTEKMRIL